MNRIGLFLYDVVTGRKTLQFLKEYEDIAKLSRFEVERVQLEKLKRLLLHAKLYVPFYKKRFEAVNFDPEQFVDFSQLLIIPPLTRQDLQNHWKDIITSNFNQKYLHKGSSSGSSGFPVVYFKDRVASSAGQAANFFGWTLSGWETGLKGLHIWGNPNTVYNEWRRLSSKIKAKVFNHHKYPAYKLTDGSLFQELFNLVEKGKYDYIDGYTNAVYLFADYIKQHKLRFQHEIKFVLTTAENLLDFQREVINKYIGPVYDTYGCSEINGIAYECKKCKMYHIMDPHVYLEYGAIKDAQGSRELLITDLDNYAFPLIRYKNDDLGVPVVETEIDCDLKFSRMKGIIGREVDILRFPDGGTLTVPSFFGSMLLKNVNGIRQYQIERISEYLIHINFVRTQDYTEKDHQIIETALHEYLKDKIHYKICYVNKIETPQTGKFKLVVDRTLESRRYSIS
jgi:phenylacetate-CoA ligase